ncbi:Chromatin structure-remodeling complex protein rsc9 [Orbilia oligospora]|nr:Chromatin structure-remodeling complex protein rsc9 [Orbilia oligospora]KAF3186972.1 Chromatin structure-remodeling complex protein rsc9 [Orbilia oligospora]KAF3248900.1 Chromatin structure-remodeling complex protein rsc9 [Orbilia oligospora]KAF3272554.1 Chromatin structure-remodeling complex protein rsc9 [Orbilia oligospora]KAF3293159.1 Chromatin structure-remodeling complex protein rsc9 [Orbilia oligospora]
MGPKNQYTAHPREFDESDIDRTPEYEAFIEEIRKLQEERGVTHLGNLEPDLQRKKVDLLKLYKTIVDQGGYTIVSNTTGLWKELAVKFNPPQHNTNIGFVLKTIYWKNLGAYECIHHWKTDAPKPEILEHVSAAGSELVGKVAPPAAESSTPGLLTRGRTGTEDPAAASTPSGRTLREAPPKRQLFQPPVPTPKPRNVQPPTQSPTPQSTITNGRNATSNNVSSTNMSHHQSNLPPLPPMDITPVPTPYSHPRNFAQSEPDPAPPTVSQQLPANFGPTDTHRAVMSLASGIPADVSWALKYLLERSCHPQLQTLRLKEEVRLGGYLIDLILACVNAVNDRQVGKVATPWKPSSYDPSRKVDLTLYNKLASTLETQEWVALMESGLYAAEILRNLTTNPQNFPLIKENVTSLLQYRSDALQILLSVLRTPRDNQYIDLQTVCLQILESILAVGQHGKGAELVELLWPIIQDNGQVMVTSALSILVNLSMQGEVACLENTPPEVLEHLGNLLMVPNEAILVPTLDFFYHYTSIPTNVDALLSGPRPYELLEQLARLLSYGLIKIPPPILPPVQGQQVPRKPVPEVTPNIPSDLLDDIVKLPEPQRAIWWMRSSFEANPHSEITQIALWQAYQQRFAAYTNTGPKPQQMLIANDFIKNVSAAFPTAKPQMIKGEKNNRFVINGIAPREVPMGLDYNKYSKCFWTEDGKVCGLFFPTAVETFTHIGDKHTFLNKDSQITEQRCCYKTCLRFHDKPTTNKREFFAHLRGHMPAKKKDPFIRNSKGEIQKITTPTRNPLDAPPQFPGITWTVEMPARDQPENYGVYVMAAKVMLNISKVQPSGADGLLLVRTTLAERLAATRNGYFAQILCDIISNTTQTLHKIVEDDIPMDDGMDGSDGSPYPA